jgi:hypothetical protein
MKPFEEQDIVEKLRFRAEIRRKIGRKADGKEDRIAQICDAAADEIERLREALYDAELDIQNLEWSGSGS